MKVELLQSVKNDLQQGFHFYEKSQFGIGGYFVRTLISEMLGLAVTAGIHSKRGNLWRTRSKKFPHWIYYLIQENIVYVLMVIDARQDPSKIKEREKKMQSQF